MVKMASNVMASMPRLLSVQCNLLCHPGIVSPFIHESLEDVNVLQHLLYLSDYFILPDVLLFASYRCIYIDVHLFLSFTKY